MFNKILIANRGEIACRVIRTAHKWGIACVAVYSEVDADALHVKLADEAFCIGSAPASESYLCGDKIIDVAVKAGAQAIHPGYGFLSENAAFAEACAKAGICFIGPPVAAIRAMGSKSAAKKIMAKAKVPLVPGYHDDDQTAKTLLAAANKIGYPVLLKAVAGGGGKGMRIVWSADEFTQALAAAKREALASFGDDTVLIEKYLTKPRHVEIQVFADSHGEVVYLFERDCSVQRRHQKVIEEAPAPGMTSELRRQMGEAAVAAARAIGYVGAGTVEFLLDEDGSFYFMEMNTRLQVEHPVTEMITGQDLVEWQLKIATGKSLPLKQDQLKINGHAFEVRIYAEDPRHDFLPSIGRINFLQTPEENAQVRLDTGIVQGDAISPYYDPMLAKLIVWDVDRAQALQRLSNALAQYFVVGVTTNLDLLAAIAEHPEFKSGKFDTGFIPKYHDELLKLPVVTEEILESAATYVWTQRKAEAEQRAALSTDPYSPWCAVDSWRMNLASEQKISFLVQGEVKNVRAGEGGRRATIFSDHEKIYLLVDGQRYQFTIVNPDTIDHAQHATESKAHLIAPMPSKVVALLVKVGEQVKRGTPLIVVEAMKMEHTIHAPADGAVKEWYFQVGALVQEGVELLEFEEAT
jgi:3-methylcrotonyl-CoA carboxylase alpha subunit